MIQKFDQFEINLSEELIDLFMDLEYDNHAVDVSCINLSKCLLSTCQLRSGDLYMTINNKHRYFIEIRSYLNKINAEESIDILNHLNGSIKKMTYIEKDGVLTWNHVSIQSSLVEKINKLLEYSKNIYVVKIEWEGRYSGNMKNIINRYDILLNKLYHIENFNWKTLENPHTFKGSAYFTENIFLYKSIS